MISKKIENNRIKKDFVKRIFNFYLKNNHGGSGSSDVTDFDRQVFVKIVGLSESIDFYNNL